MPGCVLTHQDGGRPRWGNCLESRALSNKHSGPHHHQETRQLGKTFKTAQGQGVGGAGLIAVLPERNVEGGRLRFVKTERAVRDGLSKHRRRRKQKCKATSTVVEKLQKCFVLTQHRNASGCKIRRGGQRMK